LTIGTKEIPRTQSNPIIPKTSLSIVLQPKEENKKEYSGL
jgi:hypothetical protein